MALTKRDWTLLAISAAEGEPLSPVQLQKALFLLGQMRADRVGNDFYQFEAHNYGPFSSGIYRDAEALEGDGLVTIQSDGRWKKYAATPRGLATAKSLSVDSGANQYLQRVVAWVRSLSFQALVRAIYARFPDYRANSVFQD
jgi:uncharacterized phage-associated protein